MFYTEPKIILSHDTRNSFIDFIENKTVIKYRLFSSKYYELNGRFAVDLIK